MNRREFVAGMATAALLPQTAHANDPYPDHPIRLYQGFAPGGNVDTVARVVAQGLSDAWKQPVIVDSRPGAGGNIAAATVAKAPADGYSLLLMTASHATGAASMKSLPFDPVNGFESISMVGTYPFSVLVRTDSPIKSLDDLLKSARANPGGLTYGSTGIGSIYHLETEAFARQAGVQLLHVPYKGEAPIMIALLSGEISFTFGTPTLTMPNVKGGKVRALGVTGSKPWRFLPQVPTVMQSGVNFEAASWMGLATTGATPAPIVAKLNDGVRRALASTETRSRFDLLGIDVEYSSPEAMQRRLAAEIRKWTQVVTESGIQVQ